MEIRERFDGPEDMENAIVFETGRSWCRAKPRPNGSVSFIRGRLTTNKDNRMDSYDQGFEYQGGTQFFRDSTSTEGTLVMSWDRFMQKFGSFEIQYEYK